VNNLRKISLTVALILLLAGCFQAQLNGPVSGATITVTDLRDGSPVYARAQSSTAEFGVSTYGQQTWDELGPALRLWLLGIFALDTGQLDDNRLYLVTASGGADTDADRDGQEDEAYTEVLGDWHAIMSGAALKSVGPKVSPLTEAVYQWLLTDLITLSDGQLRYNLDRAALALVADVDGENGVNYLDVLLWSRLFDQGALLANATTLNLVASSVVEAGPAEERLNRSLELVGLEVDRNALTAPVVLAQRLRGLPLADFFTESWLALLARTPETVVQLGVEDRYPVALLQLDNVSDAWIRGTYDLADAVLSVLLEFDRDSLLPAEQLSFDIYQWYLADFLAAEQHLLLSYPANSFINGLPRETLFFFTDVHPLDTPADARNYVQRLAGLAGKFTQIRHKVLIRHGAGIVEPAITLEWAIGSLRGLIDAGITGSPYYIRFSSGVATIAGLSDNETGALLDRVQEIVENQVVPAYQTLLSTLEAQRPQAPTAIGVSQFEGGAEYYAWALRHFTTTDFTATEIHQQGLDNLARVHADIRAAAEALGYDSNLTLRELFSEAGRNGGQVVGGDILSAYEELIEEAEENLPLAFDLLPQSKVVVIGGTTGGFYLAASEDGSRPGAFYASTVGSEPYYPMPSLAYHEAVPGHHLQIALARELDLPDFQRQVTYAGFTEGWALYAERLAAELGWYAGDPYGDLGRLQFEAIRAARLAADTGVHHLGWSWEQAVSFYEENTGSSRRSAEGNIGRFMRWPGQATAYMSGMNKILELRALVQQRQGGAFDIRQFHNLVLGGGSMPLTILDRVVRETVPQP
jgi:uncharacterized protein (DUF885 family)